MQELFVSVLPQYQLVSATCYPCNTILCLEEAFNSTEPTCNSHPTAADNQSNHRKGTTRLIDQASKGSCPSKYCQENTAATFDLFTQMQSCHVAFSKENHEHFVIRYRPESETNADKLGWKKVGALEPGSRPFFHPKF